MSPWLSLPKGRINALLIQSLVVTAAGVGVGRGDDFRQIFGPGVPAL